MCDAGFVEAFPPVLVPWSRDAAWYVMEGWDTGVLWAEQGAASPMGCLYMGRGKAGRSRGRRGAHHPPSGTAVPRAAR